MAIYHVEISPNMLHIVTCGHDGQVIVWYLAKGEVFRDYRGHSGWVLQARFSTDNKHLLTCSADKTVRLWDVEAAAQLHCFVGHQDMVTGCAFRATGEQCISCGKDGLIIVWDVARALKQCRGQTTNKCEVYRINSFPLNPDGKTLHI